MLSSLYTEMGDKQLVDAQKGFELSVLPTPALTPPSPSRWRILVRFGTAFFVINFLYFLHSWIHDRTEIRNAGTGSVHGWPVLNGHRAEQIYLQVPDENSAMAASRSYASLPHMAGSDQDFVTAKLVLNTFQRNFNIRKPSEEPVFSAGSVESRSATLNIADAKEPRAWIDVYYPLLNTPLNHSLEILDTDGNVAWTAQLEEICDFLDEDATKACGAVPAFHGLSKGGDVTGELFYANYGRPEDYAEVERSGVNITGKIALVRYGGIFRGLKVKGAQERGAVGTLVYSDPRDDGSVTIENGYRPYPEGPARNPTSVQRGSVQFLSYYPGDPTTPGYPAYENSTRTNGTNIPFIPSLPISWATAQVLLREIAEDGQGRAVRLINRVDDKVTPIWNTMALIPGHIGNEVVVLGNHRDAWVLGAADPSSGTTSVHELIRGLGALYRRGWKPLRTILLASWDAEEFGLIGSTEWGEDFPEWIKEHVVAYINVDSSVSGSRFGLSASPSMAHLVRKAAEDLPHPTRPGSSLWDATGDRGTLTGPADAAVMAMAEADEQLAKQGLGVSALGSGSDFTVFLQRIGVASSNGGFGSTLSDPVYHYHSIYDSQMFQEVYADPGFHRHVAVSKHIGLVLLRLADSVVLPLNTTHYTLEIQSYLDKVEEIAANVDLEVDLAPLHHAAKKLHKASVKLDKEKHKAEKHLLRIIKRWQRHRRHRHHGHHLESQWERLNRWIKHVFGSTSEHTDKYDDSYDDSDEGRLENILHAWNVMLATHPDQPPSPHYTSTRPTRPPRKLIKAIKRLLAVNKKLSSFENGFISEEGLIDREWYKHLGVAPGRWLGYGATTLPGLTEALTLDRNSTLAEFEAERLTKLIKKLAKSM
ncbi:Zn-dependent exopeptidase [Ramaria rubella]|nr:Zn-dependent exopeptidase [Ramaria rubella]